VARGQYLVNVVAACSDCHTPRTEQGGFDQTKLLSGVDCFVDAVPADANAGCLSTGNLTNHETGLRNRSDAEIKDMILNGRRPDGKFLHPIMPYWVLGNMNAADADAIVAYLRTVPAVDHTVTNAQPPFLNPAQAPRWPDAQIPRPSASYENQQAAERGRYLAGSIGVCMECHTPQENDAPIRTKAFQGGRGFPRAQLGLPPVFPDVIYTANLTPHATGIQGYTVEDVLRALKHGEDKNQGGTPLCPPMPSGPMGPFKDLTDGDARDIAHYLLSLEPAANAIPNDCLPPGFTADGGRTPEGGSPTDASNSG
jgi:mono/diheme cytochrome c family protein